MKIGLLGCKGTTLDILHDFCARRAIALDRIITLPPDIAERHAVAFYRGEEIKQYCRGAGLPVAAAHSYNLHHPEDARLFADLDLLVVIGWERLVPAAILGRLGRFACGMHGSAFGLPRGRGRSPLNWSLITDQKKFVTSLFRYAPGIDSGDVIGSLVFDINDHDTIGTLHAKNRIAMAELLGRYLPMIARGTAVFQPQPTDGATFYPKRRPEDGGIDWRQSSRAIFNLVRALEPPYPAAYCFIGERRLRILRCQPFDTGIFGTDPAPGTVLDVSLSSGWFVVACADASLLVTAFDGAGIDEIRPGLQLRGVDGEEQLARILANYPADVPPSAWEIRPAARPAAQFG